MTPLPPPAYPPMHGGAENPSYAKCWATVNLCGAGRPTRVLPVYEAGRVIDDR